MTKKLGRFWRFWPIEPNVRFSGLDVGAKLEHARLFVQSIFLSCMPAYLLHIRFDWFEGGGRFIGAATLSLGGLGNCSKPGSFSSPAARRLRRMFTALPWAVRWVRGFRGPENDNG